MEKNAGEQKPSASDSELTEKAIDLFEELQRARALVQHYQQCDDRTIQSKEWQVFFRFKTKWVDSGFSYSSSRSQKVKKPKKPKKPWFIRFFSWILSLPLWPISFVKSWFNK